MFLVEKENFDWFSTITASLISGTSLIIFIFSAESILTQGNILLLAKYLCEFSEKESSEINYEIILTLLVAIVFCLKFRPGRQKCPPTASQ